MAILEVKKLYKSYDGATYALKDCSFSMGASSICAIIGESGSGKTTLLRLIAGLERPSKGRISFDGKELSNDYHICPAHQRNIGLVFQDFALFPHITVKENIGFGIKKNKAETLARMLKLVKLEDFADKYPGELSGGQQQRVAIARTLATDPALLLLDEPFSNLDSGLKSGIRQEIRNLVKQLNTSLIFISHDLTDAIDIADEIIFLYQGEVIQHSRKEYFRKEITHPHVQALMKELDYNNRQFSQWRTI